MLLQKLKLRKVPKLSVGRILNDKYDIESDPYSLNFYTKKDMTDEAWTSETVISYFVITSRHPELIATMNVEMRTKIHGTNKMLSYNADMEKIYMR